MHQTFRAAAMRMELIMTGRALGVQSSYVYFLFPSPWQKIFSCHDSVDFDVHSVSLVVMGSCHDPRHTVAALLRCQLGGQRIQEHIRSNHGLFFISLRNGGPGANSSALCIQAGLVNHAIPRRKAASFERLIVYRARCRHQGETRSAYDGILGVW